MKSLAFAEASDYTRSVSAVPAEIRQSDLKVISPVDTVETISVGQAKYLESLPNVTSGNLGIPAIAPKAGTGSIAAVIDPSTLTIPDVSVNPDYKPLDFTPVRISLWKKSGGGLFTSSQVEGGLADYGLSVGRYVLTFKAPGRFGELYYQSDLPVSLTVDGKRVILEKVDFNGPGGVARFQVNVVQNVVLLIGVIAAAAAAIGLGAWGLSDAIDSVDKVLVDIPKVAIELGGVMLVLYIGYKAVGGH